MASFSDQFERRDPFTFNAHGILNMWPRQLAWGARRLAEGRSSSELTQIAQAADRVVVQQAERTNERLLADRARSRSSVASRPRRLVSCTVGSRYLPQGR